MFVCLWVGMHPINSWYHRLTAYQASDWLDIDIFYLITFLHSY